MDRADIFQYSVDIREHFVLFLLIKLFSGCHFAFREKVLNYINTSLLVPVTVTFFTLRFHWVLVLSIGLMSLVNGSVLKGVAIHGVLTKSPGSEPLKIEGRIKPRKISQDDEHLIQP